MTVVVHAEDKTFARIPVNLVASLEMVLSNVFTEIIFFSYSFVFSQSYVKISAGSAIVNDLAGAPFDILCRSLSISVCRFR